MDNLLQYLINLSIFIPIIIIMIVVSIKVSRANLENLSIYKYTKVIDRTSLNKDTNVFVLKIGDEGCVIVSSSSSIEKIKDLSSEEVKVIEERNNRKNLKVNNFKLNKIKLKKSNVKGENNGDTK
ncbi:flagellar biosynthesis protein FliZ [Romboutsia maritimum]|uniref:Flagellar biosynthesis protein FliZ n=1 Tax=Romboutsia maritimum TaxID=2020948 RepID=A0A371IVN3_9FIRM|nr:flagellar biosynthesis protein FliZ [Romboutsia maritimum]RDY24540.1 flagellar biosynthesis protein FliZ [Romboutsia maritimum]